MTTTTLFVYGTLRPGFPILWPSASALGPSSSARGPTPGALYDFGWYPGAKFDPDSRTRVVGEVFPLKHADRLLARTRPL